VTSARRRACGALLQQRPPGYGAQRVRSPHLRPLRLHMPTPARRPTNSVHLPVARAYTKW